MRVPAFTAVALALCALLVLGASAHADMLSLWRLDETSGTVAPNSVAGGFDGTLVNGPTWTADPERGQVLRFTPGSQYVNAGGIPGIGVDDSFSVAFWARSEQGVNNDVVLGNRFGGGSGSDTWAKFTPSSFEYVVAWNNRRIDYADIPQNEWIHHAVVKDGAAMTYYRNGVPSGSNTATAAMPALPFYMGGDAGGEHWEGRLDDVALFDHALSPGELQAAMSGSFNGFTRPVLVDTFEGAAVDATKWAVINKGLETTADGGYDPPTVAGGTVTLGGTTSHSYWAGKTLESQDTFDVPTDGELRFDVDRVSLTGSGTAYRSSMWLYADATHYHHFAQNIGENGWQYNAGNQSPTGGGVNLARLDGLDGDGGSHSMTLAHDGAYVKMFLDGRWVGSQAANFDQNIHAMLTGQARQAGDTVAAQFDNAVVSTRSLANLYDNFNGGGIDGAKWTVLDKGLEHTGPSGGTLDAGIENGELVISGSTGSQYWYGKTLESTRVDHFATPATPLVYEIDRDALTGSGTAYRSSLWAWQDDGQFIHFSQNVGETGWQYNNSGGGSGTGIGAFNAAANDNGHHVMALVHDGTTITPYLDGIAGPAIPVGWSTNVRMLVTGQGRAIGDTVEAAFDNARIYYTVGAMTPPDTSPNSFDDFQDGTIDPSRWNVLEKGLETQGPGTAPNIASQEVAGRLMISGTATTSYWSGRTLQTVDSFDASAEEPLAFEVDREFLSGTGTAYRSSLWMWVDDGQYLHFSQDVGETGWQLNSTDLGNPTGGGAAIGGFNAVANDGGNHQMQLVHDGSYIQLYLDGQLGCVVPVGWDSGIRMMLTGQGRAAGDNVAALFDNARIYHTAAVLTPADTSAHSYDDFQGSAIDTGKWEILNKGLESTADGGYNEPATVTGRLVLGGQSSHSYWAGKSLRSQDSFEVPADGEIRFEVERTALCGSGSAYRSSLWMIGDDTHYLHFSQNVGEGGWTFNAGNNNPTGGGVNLGRADSLDGDLGAHTMTLAHDGGYVKMFLDGRWVGSQAADFQQFQIMLTGQARASGDRVSAVFDNARVGARRLNGMYDDFSDATINTARWNILSKGLETQGAFPGSLAARTQDGELIMEGATGVQYWSGVTLQTTQAWGPGAAVSFMVDRDALDRGSSSAVRSTAWLWADDDHWLSFGQNLGENGWQYNYSDGYQVGAWTGGGVNIAALDALDSDPGFHELMLEMNRIPTGVEILMYLDGQLVATQGFSDWDEQSYHFMLSGMPRASGDSIFVAFDNVRIIPEPATLALLGLGLAALARRRRR